MDVVRWPGGPDDTAIPPYRGNGVVIKQNYHGYNQGGGIGVLRSGGEEVPSGHHVAHRWVWDGQSWSGGYAPFCTLRCALDFARKAYRAGWRPK
jgi:hypothetical protein